MMPFHPKGFFVSNPALNRRHVVFAATLALVISGCAGTAEPTRSSNQGLVHLADRLAEATIDSGSPPSSAHGQRDWSFPQALGEWTALGTQTSPRLAAITTGELEDGVRLDISWPPRHGSMLLMGGLFAELDGMKLGDWETVLVRARSHDRWAGIALAHNIVGGEGLPQDMEFFLSTGNVPPVFSDGSVQTYALPLHARDGESAESALESLGIVFGGPSEASVDILSISLVPRGAEFPEDFGTRSVSRDGYTSASMFAHTPAELVYPVRLAQGSRLDFSLTAGSGYEVTYRVGLREGGGETRQLFEETVSDAEHWSDHSVDLSRATGNAEIVLEATSDQDGAVAIWGRPIVSSTAASAATANRNPNRPNVIFYIIDGGGADLMSVYGYNRRTTPYLERLAEEGALFEWGYSNATWTQPSTSSFLTGLHHSVLGGLRRGIHSTPVPAAATTMAEHMRAGGYQTLALTSNPNAGRLIGTQRGVDWMWDVGSGDHTESSVDLQEEFWRQRELFPGIPYWVHFQTTDVHEPNEPKPPFSGLFVTPAEREQLHEWDNRMFTEAGDLFGTTSISGFYDEALKRTGIDRQAYYGIRRGLYDETMTHQDRQLERLVDRLKASGEWENTLLIIGADHGHPAGTFARWGRGLFDPQPEPWQGALFDAYTTRVPFIMIWPAGIEAGLRFEQPVSMIDMLPTMLDLVGLPQPEVLQGESLVPLLRGETDKVKPVILDEFRTHEATGEMLGNLEIIDGRWGASLEIGPSPEGSGDPLMGRHAVPIGGRWGAVHPYFDDVPKLLLYDLWNDPFALHAVNDEHPELVEHYRRVLQELWKANLALAQRFSDAGEVALSPDQLQQLRSLGYIQ